MVSVSAVLCWIVLHVWIAVCYTVSVHSRVYVSRRIADRYRHDVWARSIQHGGSLNVFGLHRRLQL